MLPVKRVRRILFNTLTAVSLILALANAGLWVRSMIATDVWKHDRLYVDFEAKLIRDYTQVVLGLGVVNIYAESGSPLENHSQAERSKVYRDSWRHVNLGASRSDETFLSRLARGTSWPTFSPTDGKSTSHLRIPLWLPMVVFAALPTRVVYLLCRRSPLRRLGHRPACGYDMRASPAKCSECGREVEHDLTRSC